MSRPPIPGSLGRSLRPGTWWTWAAGLAVAALCTTNPILLALLALVTGYVVAARRRVDRPSRPYELALLLAVATVVAALAVGLARHGVSRPALLAAFETGARPALVVLCLGAAATLSGPGRLLVRIPAPLRWTPVAVLLHLVPAHRRLREVKRYRPEAATSGALLRTALIAARAHHAALDERGSHLGGAPESWRIGEWCAVIAGVGTACCFLLSSVFGSALHPDPWTLQAPTIAAVPALGLLLAILPAHLTPAPPRATAPHPQASRRRLVMRAAG